LDSTESPKTFPEIETLPRIAGEEPKGQVTLVLAGHEYHVSAATLPDFLSDASFDTESWLAFHRFSWISQLPEDLRSTWFCYLWRRWVEEFGIVATGWAWHPYTVAERLINVSRYFRLAGLPDDHQSIVDQLHQHKNSIVENLEYFGEGHTGNHLANNGRGMFLAGGLTGNNRWMDIGGEILVHEASRLFSGAGALREGSTHYQLLVTSWYLECYFAANRQDRPETAELRNIALRALGFCRWLRMPACFPLVGDVSPDCTPDYLSCLWDNHLDGWAAGLDEADQGHFIELRELAEEQMDPGSVAENWIRKDESGWSCIWHTPATGWSPMPGHGHRDVGGFELHQANTPIFQDLGRRSYDSSGEQDIAGMSHNSVLVDGYEPYPPNRQYYSDDFRSSVIAQHPIWAETPNSITLDCFSFKRIRKIGRWQRKWEFDADLVSIVDTFEGTGSHLIERRFHTKLRVERTQSGIRIGDYELLCDSEIDLKPVELWTAYGVAVPATTVLVRARVVFPCTSTIVLRRELVRDGI